MDQQELEITIDANGKVSIKVAGAKGGECLDITKNLEEALGEVERREFTPEYYQAPADGNKIRTNRR
ncbi:MAG TPA: DUF2997 domain-containing protein [Methylomusa anaerophila]|uniref:DUF2997 domain-containing protein n=1 Tax=Methylomusa anaerophila TaxID=1930071 RepID=A0A348AH13_9FIRM|nr:DUF2997 domain-containing protein [Methylomusa anaerophila]BBB90361.1 hypothetical protein MAMMFC1_01009 [Methylomusa anaerophila]HML89293.1 DUF2997 domain-containing protein [Methylomusa anaerophila]